MKVQPPSNRLKTPLFNSLIIPIDLYGSETWTIKAENECTLLAFEMRCLHQIVKIKYNDHVTNEEVRRRLKSTDKILSKVRRQLLRWFGTSREWTLIDYSRSCSKGPLKGVDHGEDLVRDGLTNLIGSILSPNYPELHLTEEHIEHWSMKFRKEQPQNVP